jgi:hypothetical protein
MKIKNKDGIKWAIIFFIGVLFVAIFFALMCNSVYKIF